ncbi:MAG: tetratricopeptide repeat protein [Myxococcales bacterium]|nr:tetratricopeptide repeat protein [Myxococcales bacterium]HIM02156.1 tetratricopeptide repeat protein [Myxococcales bacterium]
MDSSPGYSPGYSLGNVARILKVSPGRLRYWQRTKLVESLATGAAGDGYGFRDLVVLRAILSLVDKGIPLQRIRRNLETLRDRLPELDDPVAALRVFGEEPNRLVIRHAGRLEETGGQLLLEFGESDSDDEEGETSLLDFDSASTTGRAAGKAGADGSATPDDAISWFERGCELDADSENWSEAIEAYGKSIELFPDYADAYCNLGAIRYNQGQRAAARQAFETCLECQNDHVEANFNLANVLEEVGEDGAALAHYRRALESDPLYPDLHVNLALLYEKLGRPRPGLEHWRRYLQIEPDGSWSDVARRKLDLESDQA